MNRPGHDYALGYGFDFGWLWALLLIVLLAGLVYVAVRLATRDRAIGAAATSDATAVEPPTAAPPVTSARQILEDRLARGEIDADEFRDRVKALEEA